MTGLLHIPELFAASANLGVLAVAEGPVALIRGTARYEAAAGTPLQSGDFIDSDESALQIEGLAGARLATGPHTRLYLDRKGTANRVILLSGWLKIDALPGTNGEKLRVNATSLSLDVSHAVSVIHTDGADVLRGRSPAAERRQRRWGERAYREPQARGVRPAQRQWAG
jgi:hypothetical protein